MTHDDLLRAGAVVAAAAILAAPHWQTIRSKLAAATKAAKARAGTIGRVAAAGLLIAAAWGKVELPMLPGPAATVTVDTPSDQLQQIVAPVRAALAGLPADRRALWASLWSKAAVIVQAEGTTATPVLVDTPALRAFTVTALELGWRRAGGNVPGALPGLREGVETAMGSVLGSDAVPVTDDMRARYVDVCRAIAWAATR